MQKSALPFPVSETGKTELLCLPAPLWSVESGEFSSSIPVSSLPFLIEDWLNDCESGAVSANTIDLRRVLTGRFLRFLAETQATRCGVSELRAFFAQLRNPKTGEPLRPVTVDTYRRAFSAFFRWLVNEGELRESPITRIKKPPVKKDIIQPLSLEQIEALVAAAKREQNATLRARNVAILLFILDTGVRSGEIRGLTVDNLDLTHRQARVLGKGNKWRTVYFGKRTARALFYYLNLSPRQKGQTVFLTESGANPHEAFTRRGFYQVISKLFQRAHIRASKRGAHILRHTFAIQYLRGGGRQKELMMILGHENMTQTNAYTAIADADLESQHRRCSPVERLKL
jgi:integrase/recombinase XerD